MHRSKSLEIGVLAVILVAAAALRFLWLDTIPVGWHHLGVSFTTAASA